MGKRHKKVTLLILAGGLGTRLKGVVHSMPKPLAPVKDQSFLELLIKNYYKQGIRNFIFSLHYQADQIIDAVSRYKKSKKFPGASFDFVVEPELLGTGGAVKHAVKERGLEDSFMITNSDTWLESGVTELVHIGSPSIGLVYIEKNNRYGSVKFIGNIVTSFREKDVNAGSSYINAGLYYLNPKDLISFEGKKFSLERAFLPKMVSKGKLKSVILKSHFIDIGIPEDYHKFCRWIIADKDGEL